MNTRLEYWFRWLLFVLRIGLGGLFIFSGVLKILSPLEEFQGLIREYQFLPESLIPSFAVVLPISEVIFGLALVIGLLERYAAAAIGLMTLSFIIAISSALARGISLANCGCFGAFKFAETPQELLVRDGLLLLVAILLAWKPSKRLALDNIL